MKTLLVAVAILLAQQADFNSAVLTITGASCIEELDESEIERFQGLNDRPVNLNTASKSKLLSSGLMSSYQVASLMEYRERTGQILSISELSLIDGFSESYADALSLFTKLVVTESPGQKGSRHVSNTLTTKATVRQDGTEKPEWSAGAKYGLGIGERFELNWARRFGWSEKEKGPGTISAAWYGKGHLGKVVLGHFNSRFGQGLAVWSGFSMSGIGEVGSMKKSGTGFSPTNSFSPEDWGAACDANFGRWTLSGAWSFTSGPVVNVNRTFRKACIGTTATPEVISIDWKAGAGNVSTFGEVAWDGAPAALAGLWWVPEYGRTFCALGRWYSPAFKGCRAGAVRSSSKVSDEAGIALGYGGKLIRASADACMHPGTGKYQLKGTLNMVPEFTAGAVKLRPALKMSSRFSTRETYVWRNEARVDMDLDWSMLRCHTRLDILHCRETSWLTNAEAGWNSAVWQAFIRWTLFKIDCWEDRIYVYERDAPGSFNVPAYYGRGCGLSFFGSYRPNRRHALWLRLSALRYPWTEGGKAARTEARLQYRLSL